MKGALRRLPTETKLWSGWRTRLKGCRACCVSLRDAMQETFLKAYCAPDRKRRTLALAVPAVPQRCRGAGFPGVGLAGRRNL